MCGQCILRHQLLRDPACEALLDTAPDVDIGKLVQLVQLGRGARAEFGTFARKVGLFGVGL